MRKPEENIFRLLLLAGVDVLNRWKDLYHLWESHTDDHILVRALISLRYLVVTQHFSTLNAAFGHGVLSYLGIIENYL